MSRASNYPRAGKDLSGLFIPGFAGQLGIDNGVLDVLVP